MTDAAITAITRELEKFRNRLEQLEEQRQALEAELPVVKSSLEALTRSLAILKGEDIETTQKRMLRPIIKEEDSTSLPFDDKSLLLRKGSSSYAAYMVLYPNNSLTINELFEIVKEKIPELKKRSFESGIYRFIREKRFFKKDDLGKISILRMRGN